MGNDAAMNYFKDVIETVETLAKMPTIGREEKSFSKGKNNYYSFLVHPKYRIVYRYTQRTLYIVTIKATMMK
jgi:plasmid stabilization system protein ParE